MNERVTLETQENALRNYIPKLSSDFAGASFILLGNLHPKVQLQVLEQLFERTQLIVLDTMNYWIENTPELLDEAIRKIDILTVSDEEARALTGESNFLKAV